MHNEQQANVGTLSAQSKDCQSSEQTLLTSYDIDMLMKTRKMYEKIPIIGFLNINSLRSKVLSLKETLHKAPIDMLCIDETKLDETFPDAQFLIENYQFPPLEETKIKKGGGKMVFIRKELLAKRLEDFETKSTETICIELLISKRNWCIIFTYRPPKYDKKVFFQELSKTISQAIRKYDSILVAGDLNIDVSGSKGLNDNHFSELTDTFNLANLVKTSTCFKTTRGILLDALLTNTPNSLQKTSVCKTRLSDCHKMVFTIFRSTLIRLSPKIIKYKYYKGFNENIFCHEIYKSEEPYSKLSEIFQEILQKHTPLKSKQVRGNHAPFMNKELSKVIMNKSRLRNKYLKWPSRESFLAYKKVKNKCNTLTRKTEKINFKYIGKNKNFATNETFWNRVRPFITNKGTISDENIKIKAEENQNIKIKNKNKNKLVFIKTNDYIKDESVLVEMFNNHYINIVEKTAGITLESLEDSSLSENDEETVNKILKHSENHPNVSKIKCNQNETLNFDFPTAKVEDIKMIAKSLNPRKATRPDGIPIKILKIARNVIDSH